MLLNLNKKIISKKKNKIGGKILPPFNPITSPNTVAVWDGDTTCDPAKWIDLVASYQIDFFNLPFYDPSELNGHGTISFDGINQYGTNNVLVLNQPFTIYMVTNRITTGMSLRIWNTNNNFMALRTNLSLNLSMTGTGVIISEPDPALNTFDILTMVFNGSNSELRTNNNISVIGDIGIINGLGMNLACSEFITLFANCKFAYIILRNVADNTTVQNNFINWLKNRFAI